MATVDLRDLALMINEKKNLNANLSLEFDCTIEIEDVKPLVKVMNYLINYLNQYTETPISLTLNAAIDHYNMGFIVSSTEETLSPISSEVEDALGEFYAKLDVTHEKGRYIQASIIFNHG